MKIYFSYRRIPENPYELSRKGKPKTSFLHPYLRGEDKGVRWGTSEHLDLGCPYPRGGKVTCNILDEGNRRMAFGTALCSMSDNFCYKTGRDIAYGRAMKALETFKIIKEINEIGIEIARNDGLIK